MPRSSTLVHGAAWLAAPALGAALAAVSCSLAHDTEKLASEPVEGSGLATSGSASSTGGAAGGVSTSSGASAGAGQGGAVSIGSGGAGGSACPQQPCPADFVCIDGECVACGQAGQACCNNGVKYCEDTSTSCCQPGTSESLCGESGTTCLSCCTQCQGQGWFTVYPNDNQTCHDAAKNKCQMLGCGDNNCLNDWCWAADCSGPVPCGP